MKHNNGSSDHHEHREVLYAQLHKAYIGRAHAHRRLAELELRTAALLAVYGQADGAAEHEARAERERGLAEQAEDDACSFNPPE